VSVTHNECLTRMTFIWRNAPPRKCRLCGRGIVDSEVAIKLRGEHLACSDCRPGPWGLPCDACGRKVAGHRFCNYRCRAHYYNAPAAARRKAQRLKARQGRTCEVCAKEFTPKRSDAKTCSGACKQKAYRQRSKEAA
jgi:hypothetical protein